MILACKADVKPTNPTTPRIEDTTTTLEGYKAHKYWTIRINNIKYATTAHGIQNQSKYGT